MKVHTGFYLMRNRIITQWLISPYCVVFLITDAIHNSKYDDPNYIKIQVW